MKISFVIPCFRSEATVEGVVAEIKDTMALRAEYDYEIVLVSDHSPDGVYAVIERLAAADSRIKGLELARNFGQHAALMAGYRKVTGDIVFSLDDDGQAPVESVWKVFDQLVEGGFDAVYGEYPKIQQDGWRRWGSQFNDWVMVWLLDKPIGRRGTSFFAIRKQIVDEIVRYQGPYPFVAGLLFRLTKNIGFVSVEHRRREVGTSGYNLWKLISLWMNVFTTFSVKPLRLASYAGLVSSVFGFVLAFWTVFKKLFLSPGSPMGYSSLMAAIFFIGGMLMLILGLIGEYVGRIYISLNQAPQYVVARETRTMEDDKS